MEIRLIIFIALAAAAILTKLLWPRAYTVSKPLPILFILALAFLKPGRVDTLWLAALSFGLAGDLLLLSGRGFVPGPDKFSRRACFLYTGIYARGWGILLYPALNTRRRRGCGRSFCLFYAASFTIAAKEIYCAGRNLHLYFRPFCHECVPLPAFIDGGFRRREFWFVRFFVGF